MIVVQDFTPCVEDELRVQRGQKVKALYQENEWRFVVAEDGREGFIPYTFCIPIEDSTVKHQKHSEEFLTHGTVTGNYRCKSSHEKLSTISMPGPGILLISTANIIN